MPDRRARPPAAVLSRDPVVVAIVGFCVLAGAWYLVEWGGERSRAIGTGLCQVVINGVLAVLYRRVAGLPSLPAPTRRLWNAFAVGALCAGAGDVIQVFLDLGGALSASDRTAHEIGLVVGVALPVCVMLALPNPSGSRRERLRFWLDASTVMAGAAAFAWYFSVSGSSGAPGDPIGPILVMGVQLVAAFALVKLLLTGAAGFVREAVVCGALGIGLEGVITGVIPAVHSSWVSLLVAAQMLPSAMLMIAPRIQELRMRADPELLVRKPKRAYSLLPYLAVAATLALLVVVFAGNGIEPSVWGVVVGVVVSTSLVVARQLAAFSENADLLAQLEASFRELHHQASHDHLTQLANRALFTERTRLSTPSAADPTAIVMIDLDDFKPINDTLGHHVGDAVLVAVAERLRGCVRPGDTVARLGGDEFAILLPVTTTAEAERVVDRFTAALTEPLQVEGHLLHVHASIGLATGISDDPDVLLRRADDAMYTAKRAAAAGAPVQRS